MGVWNQYLASFPGAICLFVTLAGIPAAFAQGEADLSRPIFPHYALALRSAVLASENDALRLLATIPGTSALIDLNAPDSESTELIEQLWIPFFQNVLVEIKDEESEEPAALYYNPLSDAGLYTRWAATDDGRYQIVQLMALPGERLGNQGPLVFDLPEWTMADDIVSSLAGIVENRRIAFAEYDRNQRLQSDASVGYRAASNELLAVAPRLVQDTVWREGWSDFPWLPGTLEHIQQLLKAHDPIELVRAAPETGLEMAELLSSLPDTAVENLVLDRVLEAGKDSYLLIGSRPDDGTTYVWVSCRITGSVCAIGGLAVLSFAQATR